MIAYSSSVLLLIPDKRLYCAHHLRLCVQESVCFLLIRTSDLYNLTAPGCSSGEIYELVGHLLFWIRKLEVFWVLKALCIATTTFLQLSAE